MRSGACCFSEIKHRCTCFELIPAEKYRSLANKLLKKWALSASSRPSRSPAPYKSITISITRLLMTATHSMRELSPLNANWNTFVLTLASRLLYWPD